MIPLTENVERNVEADGWVRVKFAVVDARVLGADLADLDRCALDLDAIVTDDFKRRCRQHRRIPLPQHHVVSYRLHASSEF